MSKHLPQVKARKRTATTAYPAQRKRDTSPARCEARRLAGRKHTVFGDLQELRHSVQVPSVGRMTRKDRRNCRAAAYNMEVPDKY